MYNYIGKHKFNPIQKGNYLILCAYADDGKIHEHESFWDGTQWSCFRNPATLEVLGWKELENQGGVCKE